MPTSTKASRKLLACGLSAFLLTLAGCSSAGNDSSSESEADSSDKVFYWIQGPKGVPVHRISQYGFLQGCKDEGMTCEVVGPDSGDLPPLVDVVNAVGAKTDVAGVALWSGGLPLFQEPLQAFADNDIPIAIPHFYVDEGFYPGDVAVVSGDIEAGAADVAVAMCGDLEGQSGSVAVTQNGLNTTENTYSETFTETMNTECPDIDVLPVELEGIDPAEAVAVAVGIMQANPDLIGAVSTTGGGGTTWALAQEQTNKQIVAYATDYTRENLALIESGEITGVLAQPVFEESRAAAGLLLQLSQGETVEHWTKLPTVVVTEANLDEYLTLLDEVEAYADGL